MVRAADDRNVLKLRGQIPLSLSLSIAMVKPPISH